MAQRYAHSATREAAAARRGGSVRSGRRPDEMLPGQAGQLRALQSIAGNQAVAGLVQRWPEDAQVHPEVEPRRNDTGLPDHVKTGIEALSGFSLDNVRVHFTSARPAQVSALAYTHGSDIHVAPGQEAHLPHEAWHVVQQAQGRVRPTTQLKDGRRVNDDGGLEREADVMGARALRARPFGQAALGSPLAPQIVSRTPVIQMVKYIRKRNGAVVEVQDEYKKKANEKWATEADFLASNRGGEKADAKREQLRQEREEQERVRAEEERVRAVAARKKERADRRARVAAANVPESRQGKQVKFPGVVGRGDNREADLAYRGMSVNNIRNMQQGGAPIFTVQNPRGGASALEHIVDDSEASPYLSFEAGGLGISAGKYAAKPVDPVTKKPYGVEQRGPDFIKQEKSYTAESRRKYPNAKRIGYVGGIPSTGPDRLDVSDTRKATAIFRPSAAASEEARERRQKAVDLAVADKEVLVKPGDRGITPAQVPFVGKVQEVDEAYYQKNLTRQTSRKGLGYYKPFDGPPVYSKIQVPRREGNDRYKLAISDDFRRVADDSEDEMSDIEDIDLDDY